MVDRRSVFGLVEQFGEDTIQSELSASFDNATDYDDDAAPPTSLLGSDTAAGPESDAEIFRLASLERIDYDRERKVAAKRLNVRAATLDQLVAAEREPDGVKQGRALSLPEPAPWAEPVDGARLLSEISAAIRLHIVLPDHAADAAALWAVHTYLLDIFGITPRLAITSPEKGCGKTTLLDVLERLVWRPLLAANLTASVVFRVVEMRKPTLLIDEADLFLAENEELRGILNSGHRRGGCAIRNVGDEFEPRAFSTYSACAIALIGKPPATLTDRSIAIELQRRRPDEPIEPFRFDRTHHLDRLAAHGCPLGGRQRRANSWCRPRHAGWSVQPRGRHGARFLRSRTLRAPIGRIALAERFNAPRRHTTTNHPACSCSPISRRSSRNGALERLSSGELVECLVAIEGHPWAEWGKAKKPITKNWPRQSPQALQNRAGRYARGG